MSDEREDTGSLALVEMAGRTRLRLRVKPGAKKNALLGVHNGALKLSVIARPERGKANRGVQRLLAAQLDLAISDIEIVSGAASQDKTVFIALTAAALTRRIRTLLNQSAS